MNVPSNVMQEMLKNITDPRMREIYGSIINGDITHVIRCTSKVCKSRIIGYIHNNGSSGTFVRDNLLADDNGDVVVSEKTGLPVSGVRSSRERLDGQRGFSCWCGNNSILANEEKDVIGANIPSLSDMQTVADRLTHRKSKATPSVNGSIKVDGFIIEEVTA